VVIQLPRQGARMAQSIPDQVKRFANANEQKNTRYLDITTVYDGSGLKDKRILITGAEQGLGLELVKEIVAQGGVAIDAGRTSSEALDAEAAKSPKAIKVITGVDVTKEEGMKKMCAEVGEPVDIVINCAGYFYVPEERIGVTGEGHLNFDHQKLQIDVCALGPLRVTSALYLANLIKPEGKVIIITSQAGSCEWRTTQNTPDAAMNYGHHMSRSACNMAAVLMSQEFKPKNIPVQLLHPGFNRTAMTKKYEAIWDIEGAVQPEVGAKRVLYETLKTDMSRTGTCINCEDGLVIPW